MKWEGRSLSPSDTCGGGHRSWRPPPCGCWTSSRTAWGPGPPMRSSMSGRARERWPSPPGRGGREPGSWDSILMRGCSRWRVQKRTASSAGTTVPSSYLARPRRSLSVTDRWMLWCPRLCCSSSGFEHRFFLGWKEHLDERRLFDTLDGSTKERLKGSLRERLSRFTSDDLVRRDPVVYVTARRSE